MWSKSQQSKTWGHVDHLSHWYDCCLSLSLYWQLLKNAFHQTLCWKVFLHPGKEAKTKCTLKFVKYSQEYIYNLDLDIYIYQFFWQKIDKTGIIFKLLVISEEHLSPDTLLESFSTSFVVRKGQWFSARDR